jgi:hypothetical protein
MNKLIPVLFFAACVAFSPSPVQSNESDQWQFQIAPLYLWAMNLDGTMRLPTGLDSDFEVDLADAFDNLQTMFTLHFEANKGRRGLLAEVGYPNLKGNQPIPGPGEEPEIRVKNLILEAGGGVPVLLVIGGGAGS